MRKIYLGLAVVGFIIPYALVIAFIHENGLNLRVFVSELFGNYAPSLAMADLLLSSVVFWAWLFSAEQKNRVRSPWMFVALNLGVGLCFALPLYLYMRAPSTGTPANRV